MILSFHLLPLPVMLYLLILMRGGGGGGESFVAAPYSNDRMAHMYEQQRPNGVR